MAAFCPGSSLLLEHKTESGVDMLCMGYKYNRKRVLTFLMTKGCANTTPGKPYHTEYLSDDGTRTTKDIDRPEVLTLYFEAAGMIDQHNHNRQGTLGLEDKWNTRCGYFRIFTSITGIGVTDSWLSYGAYINELE